MTTVAPAPTPRRDPCTGVGNPVHVTLPPGFCLRPIATGLLRPRQMTVGPDGELLVAESGPGWRAGHGGVSVLRASSDGTFSATRILSRLDRPHGIALRDHQLYIAESGRISHVAYPVADGATPQSLLDHLPLNGRHEHKTLGFGPDGQLYFSIGSATDNCGRADASNVGDEPCPELEGIGATGPDPTQVRAVVRRWDPRRRRVETFARGLRNNLGFAWHPASHRMWGVENSRDYIQRVDPSLADATLPHDELNELVADANYGWPYCYDLALAAPEYHDRARFCRESTRVPVLLPPHSAPISIAFYDGTMFPASFRGRAFITLHGYRDQGHRLVTIPFDTSGQPSGPIEDLITGWERRPDRPQGHLLGIAQSNDGAVYISDDVNGAIYLLAWGESALGTATVAPTVAVVDSPDVLDARCRALASATDPFSVIERTTVDVRCVACHASAAGGLFLRACDARGNYETLLRGGSQVYGPYVAAGHAELGYLLARLRGNSMGPQMPFQNIPLPADELAAIEAWIRDGAHGPLNTANDTPTVTTP